MMNDDLELYEDEPMTSVRASEFSGNQLIIENMDDVERKRQKRKRKRKKRLERLGKLAVCICCLGVIAAIVVTVVLTEAAIAVTSPSPPSRAPTPMPAVPTYSPTVPHPTMKVPMPTTKPPSQASPTMKPMANVPATPAPTFDAVANITLTPIGDTYVLLEGPDLSRNFGREPMILVRNGLKRNAQIPDAVGLLVFDTTSIPKLDTLTREGASVTLKLHHQPLEIADQVRGAAPITVSRAEATELIVESLSGSTFEMPGAVKGPTVEVPVDGTEVTVDITDLFFNTEDLVNQDQLFLILQVFDQEQAVGDWFYSRESDTPPELLLTGLAP